RPKTIKRSGRPHSQSSLTRHQHLKMDLDLAWYLKAYCHAQMQADDFALLALQKAVALNPTQWIEMALRETAFDSLRGDPRFQVLMAS
ncbi:MAG: tetratricopeptide repeat protein, partial [Cyanobacteria bacterium J06636_28]